MTLRKSIFWVHLTAGVTAGIIVAVMSFTGIVIAFEAEILRWLDRDVTSVQAESDTQRMPIAELQERVQQSHPDFRTTQIIVPSDSGRAYEFRAGRDGTLYVDPYSADVREPASTGAHDVLHVFEEWHRWLGMEGEGRDVGKMITGVSNLAFLFLCVSGIYLWWPRRWTSKFLRPITVFNPRLKGSARHFNWHHVFGSWSVLVLIVLTTTASVFSFGWANRLVFTLAGEEPPARGPGAGGPPVPVQAAPGATPLSYDDLVTNVAREFPEWQSISIELPKDPAAAGSQALALTVLEPALFQARGRTQLSVDQYRGEIVKKTAFADRTTGAQARTWIRFLHTGEAFGLIGKLVAVLASAASLFLVYTGVLLAWRRLFGRKPAVQPQVADQRAG